MSIVNTLKHGVKVASTFAKANSPVICTGIALVGLAATVVSVVKATKKTSELVKKAEEEKGDKLTKKEFIKVAWKPCVAAIISVIVTGAAIVSAQYAASAKLKSAAAAYSALLASKDALIEQVEETGGSELMKEVKEKLAKKEINPNGSRPVGGENVLILDEDGEIFQDQLSGQFIKAKESRVNYAIVKTQAAFSNNKGDITAEEFYRHMRWPYDNIPGAAEGMTWGMTASRADSGWVPEISIYPIETQDGQLIKAIHMEPDGFPF